jgi:hypothetical protein
LLPWRARQSGDLVDRPGPDQFDETEDRRDTVVQEFQELFENLFHGRTSLLNECGEAGSGSLKFDIE